MWEGFQKARNAVTKVSVKEPKQIQARLLDFLKKTCIIHTMPKEVINNGELSGNITAFTRLGNGAGVNNWLLKGDPRQGGRPEVFVGSFPKLLRRPGGLVLMTGATPDVDPNYHINRVLALTIPENAVKIPDDPWIRGEIEAVTVVIKFPSSALVLGSSPVNGEEVVALYALFGMSADTALSEIKRGMRLSLRKQNQFKQF